MKNGTSTLVGLALITSFTTAFANSADAYPKSPIKIIVNFPAGGTIDVLARIMGQKLSQKWGQPVVVENRTGAGGNIGAEVVAKAAPDGYTLLASPPAPFAINQFLYKSLSFDPTRFAPVTVLATVPNVLAVRTDFPAKNAKDFINYAKQEQGKVTVATQGNGTTSHLTASMFAKQSGSAFTYVPYKGTAPALTDLMGGQVDAFFDNIASMSKLHEAGKARIIAVAGDKRSPLLPNVPTIAESALPNFNASTWFALAAPPGTPIEITQKLSTTVSEILKQKDVQQKFFEQGAEIVGNSPGEMAEFLTNERARWKKVIDSAGVTMN